MANGDKWRQSSRYVSFRSIAPQPTTVSAPRPTVTQLQEQQRDLPSVVRPDVPEVDEQASPGAMDSVLGWVADKMDNVIPDDMGGMARGTSGWLNAVPGYQQTTGAVVGGALSSGESLMNAMYWGSEQADHLGAMVFSAMPGGMDTVGWDKAHEVSAGQAAATTTIGSESVFGILFNGALDFIVANSDNPEAAQAMRDQWQGEGAFFSVTNPDIDLNDKEQRDKAMSVGAGMLISGAGDVLFDVLADPTIIGGKVSSVLRYGTKAGRIGGLSNQTLVSAERVQQFGSRIDDNVAFKATNGAEGKWTAEGEHISDLISGRDISNNVFVKNSANPKLLTELAMGVKADDFATGAALVKAAAGDASGWRILRERDILLYDRFANGMGVDPLEILPGRTALTPDQIAYGSKVVAEANAVAEASAAGQLIARGGSRSATGARLANAWRRGATVTEDAPIVGGANGWGVRTIEAVAGSRPVRVIRWLGQESPSGIVHLKGGDGNTSLREVQAFIRKSKIEPTRATRLYDDYARATTPEARREALFALERAEVEAVAAQHGISPKVAQQMYEDYARSRSRYLVTLRQHENAFAVDEAGEIVTTPGMYTELDEAFPMLNQAAFHKVVRQNARWLAGMEDITNVLDTVNKYWKLSVLLRLGYTQRNVAEGAMRSLAALGTAAMNPRAFTRLPANAYYYAGTRRLRRTLAHQERALNVAHENLRDARQLLIESRREARVSVMFAQRERAAALTAPIRRLENKASRTAAEQRELDRLIARRQRHLDEADRIKRDYVDPAVPDLTRLGRNEALLLNTIDELSQEILDTATRVRASNSRRVKVGESGNVMEDGTVLPGAFQNAEGDIARLLSSADNTAMMTFDAGFESRRSAQEISEHWVALDIDNATPGQIQDFWDEYAIRLNQRYRNDPIISAWLAADDEVTGVFGGNMIERTKRWLMSPAGRNYRESVSIDGRRLSGPNGVPREAAIEQYLTDLWGRYNREIPKGTGLRPMLASDAVTPAEVAAAFGRNTPPPIPVRVKPQERADSIWQQARRGVDSITGALMKGLGSFPETTLLRHPFYDAVYRAEQSRLWRLAADQGQDMTSATTKVRINKSAHNAALKATKTTMYTIERVSNMGTALRWVAPFFPAFENALKTWGRLAYQKPQILGYAGLAWNVPNNLGLVVDSNGDPVERSNMFKDEGNFVVMPQVVNDFLVEHAPDFLNPGGDGIAWRQGGFNVVFPGGDWWWPGVGPMALTPTALVLRGKPEAVDILRANLSDTMFNSIVPSGNPNVDIKDLWLSTSARRLDQMFTGTSENGAYLTLVNTIVEDTYIEAQIAGRPVTQADMRKVMATVNKFWKWSIRSAVMDFTPSRYYSPYEPQRGYWRKLLDDQSLSYEDKLATFKAKFPDMMAITRSGTESIYGLQPNLSTWEKLQGNPELVAQLNNIDPQLVGMFANMGSWDDPFSYSVYGEFKNTTIGKDGKPIKDQLDPQALLKNNEVTDGWVAKRELESTLESQARLAGHKSLNVVGAKPWLDLLREGEERIAERYPLWGIEKETYKEQWPKFIAGARIIVQNKGLVGEDTTVGLIDQYLQLRDYIAGERAKTSDDDLRAQLTELGYQKAAELRGMDIGFADFYDRYLVYDDFREL